MATRLLVVKDGKIAEHGTQRELLSISCGVYRKLYEMQIQLHEAHAI
jgi:ABC-type multidrug transport system fused ATPase/permease subunit